MDKAFIGLIGVALGVFLGILKDWLFQRRKTKKEYEYLAILVVCILDRFVSECNDVVNDDGKSFGEYDKDGYARAQVTPPSFDPQLLDVEWKSLPPKLMYKILNFPNQIESANKAIGSTYDFVASPPYYEEFFEERRFQYSKLGITAFNLATKLRVFGRLPPYELTNDWNPQNNMKMKLAEIDSFRATRAKAHNESMEQFTSNDSSK